MTAEYRCQPAGPHIFTGDTKCVCGLAEAPMIVDRKRYVEMEAELAGLRTIHARCSNLTNAEASRIFQEATAERSRADRATAALPDPGKLWALADWIDAKYPDDSNPEVQRDLRSWARSIFALGLHRDAVVPGVCEADHGDRGAAILEAARGMADAIDACHLSIPDADLARILRARDAWRALGSGR